MMSRALGIAVTLSLACGLSMAAPPIDIGGYRFEGHADMDGTKLQLNGAGVRYKAIFKVYAAGLYAESQLSTPEAVYRDAGAKRMHVVMLREVESGGFGKMLMQGMETNLPRDQLKHCIPGIVQLGEVFSAKKRLLAGGSFTLETRQGSGTVVKVNGQVMAQTKDPMLFICLMHNYLGDSPVDAALKPALLGHPPRVSAEAAPG
jgi:hypothetical protein